MDTNALKKFAQSARNLLIDQVTSKLDVVLAEGSAARREAPKAVKDLENAINKADKQQIIEQVAYTWFNRFTALRFMDANGYTQVRTVSPADGATRPELLSEAMAGNLPDGAPATIQSLLDGRTPSHDLQAEAYRLLLVHTCNQWHGPMTFLFEQIDDYTELLMPEDLLSQTSILAELRKVMTEDACQDVEIIGWLYQFYISEKKDQVFAGLKKNQKITAENIPAATQLFTPHWIVRYLVENSLGRLWLLNHPQSGLAAKMDYYIAPEEPEADFLKITKPEDIRICDPAAGSGHMLTYAFDLLYAIYEEEGYDATEIPALILTHNLTGVEIDDRAGALAAFALAMKAAGKLGRRRFLRMEAKPDICVLQNVAFTDAEMQDVAAVVGKDLFTDELRETLGQFEQAKNFGSLIVPKLRDPAETLRVVEARDFGGDLLLKEVQERVIAVLRMAEALSPKYHVVVANPPYMGAKGMNDTVSDWLKANYPDFKSDLFAAFIPRCARLGEPLARIGIMSPHVWMFISSHERLRVFITEQNTLTNVVELPLTGFAGATVQIAAYNFINRHKSAYKANFISLLDFAGGEKEMPKRTLAAIQDRTLAYVFRASGDEFISIPGRPIAYAAGKRLRETFLLPENIGEIAKPRQGMATTNNDLFLRIWSEVSADRTNFDSNSETDAFASGAKWFPYNKGGPFRKWSGNFIYVVNFENRGKTICDYIDNTPGARVGSNGRVINREFYFKEGVTWSDIKTGGFGARLSPSGFIFDVKGSSGFPDPQKRLSVLGLLSSKLAARYIDVLNPTVTFQVGDIARIPYRNVDVDSVTQKLSNLSKSDWDAYETSWDFTTLPLLSPDHRAETLAATYTTLRTHWQSMTDEMQRLEEENNRIFIDAYGLQDELTPEVPIEEITLTCNPAYRYGVKGSEADRETRLRADTMAEFLSYAVGCMFGRYSLDAPGLILANQGERLEDYLARAPEPSFMPDEDNVIPVLDENWFPDDITERFRLFLRVTFGEAHFRENLKFIEDSLGKDIRKYFTKDFYADHVKRYKKRPIYWMVSSPKGTFNALIYMHRYRADTVSVLLNDYLREFITKLEGERTRLEKLADDPTATQGQKTKALKDVAKVAKQIDELNEWERDVIFPLAQQKIEIDLDDGVKANYPKFGSALKKIAGLS
ncbi:MULTISPECIES: BREX-1 system adenine-specific DNA-methyltransferase PglX [Halocynthiibacter]|uniref:site-specific DNA-methyltransferase (adenine-specific) n=1 Tax=Halocynthiibacter halioticoli TaxID=2986804 RepID=A0AAE3J1K8_9RHOB|nr:MULTISPECIES: BREX-1 system adenine-specific DNA-methyltransferase PglX [Halocynthiibacter]MCV6824873.1 BREX-1 system adenine-specific DNA-methyltransferase PglX [Halocynthiibacter halioticoli]MCW4057874.1 BREX-1 system adenine-specific DNA-methyltransferase PglX [Halocynthiibacter sp. SDUM655004]